MKSFVGVALLLIGASALPSEFNKDNVPVKTLVVKPIEGSVQETKVAGGNAKNCGISNTGSRIVHGVEAGENEFPWVASLLCTGRFFCTASILNEEWILTAAHCVDGCAAWEVTVGDNNWRTGTSEYRQVIKSSKGITHPDWNYGTLANDIALVKLDRKITFNFGVRPACLPSKFDSDASDGFAGELTIATGWGKEHDGDGSATSELRKATDRKVISNAECKRVFGSTITAGHICIDTGTEHEGVCSGDSGGPLNLPYKGDANRFRQIGVTSFVSGAGCEAGFPDGYTRVTHYLDWISGETGITIED